MLHWEQHIYVEHPHIFQKQSLRSVFIKRRYGTALMQKCGFNKFAKQTY